MAAAELGVLTDDPHLVASVDTWGGRHISRKSYAKVVFRGSSSSPRLLNNAADPEWRIGETSGEVVAVGVVSSRRARFHPQFAEDVRDMNLHRAQAEEQFVGNLLVGLAGGHHA